MLLRNYWTDDYFSIDYKKLSALPLKNGAPIRTPSLPLLLFQQKIGENCRMSNEKQQLACYYPSKVFALATTLSTVKPNFSIQTPPGAEAPNWSMPIETPSSPT